MPRHERMTALGKIPQPRRRVCIGQLTALCAHTSLPQRKAVQRLSASTTKRLCEAGSDVNSLNASPSLPS